MHMYIYIWARRLISGRVYCIAKALWKLGWFLRDFLYDPDLLGREEVDEKALSGLRGVVKISHDPKPKNWTKGN